MSPGPVYKSVPVYLSTDALAKFISTEATFERFVLENALSEKSTAMASSELADIRQKLDDIIHSDFKVYDVALIQIFVNYD